MYTYSNQRTEKEARLVKELLGILGILILLIELYRYLRMYWLRRLVEQKKKEKRNRKPAVLRPKSERDCRFCCEDKGKRTEAKHEMPVSWQMRKGRGGRKKKIHTEGTSARTKAVNIMGLPRKGSMRWSDMERMGIERRSRI
jgi:hypothetical protein